MADRKLTCFLYSVRMNWEYSTVHSRVTIHRKEKVLAEVFCWPKKNKQKKTTFAKFKTNTDLFQSSWSALTFRFEAGSLQLCPITSLNHTCIVNANWLIRQTQSMTPGLNNNSKTWFEGIWLFLRNSYVSTHICETHPIVSTWRK